MLAMEDKARIRWDIDRGMWRQAKAPGRYGRLKEGLVWLKTCECGRQEWTGMSRRHCNACRKARNSSLQAIRGQAHRAVAAAIKRGELPRLSRYREPSSGVDCVDCGQEARVYDHRDYSRPLDVEPVCFYCNRERGPAANWAHNLIKLPRHFSKTIQ